MLRFRSEKLTEHITRIFGITDEQMYLIEGREKAVLIDTGCGVGSLKSFVDRLTKLPIIVLLTHGHVDHAMGAGEFSEVYMNRRDDYIYVQHREEQVRMDYVAQIPENTNIQKEEYVPAPECDFFLDLKEGDEFDLGEISIKIFECPGHTRGSVVMLIPEERVLLLGDSCNPLLFLFDDYSEGLSTYEKNLRILKEKVYEKYDTVLLSHGYISPGTELIEEVLAVCTEIRQERTDNVPFEFMGKQAYIAKAIGADMMRLDGKVGNIVYDPKRIWK